MTRRCDSTDQSVNDHRCLVSSSNRRRIAPLPTLGLAVILALGTACGATDPAVAPQVSGRDMPAWQGMDRELFGDEIDPVALGLLPPRDPRKDEALAARAQRAELVGRVRVQTFNADDRGGEVTYRLTLRFADPPLVPTELTEREFEVHVDARDAAFGVLKAVDAGVKRTPFIGLVRRYSGVDDTIVVHFYLAPDTPEVATAIQEVIAVQELGTK
jgi:hypothetical protein